jgi:hypothetical protein
LPLNFINFLVIKFITVLKFFVVYQMIEHIYRDGWEVVGGEAKLTTDKLTLLRLFLSTHNKTGSRIKIVKWTSLSAGEWSLQVALSTKFVVVKLIIKHHVYDSLLVRIVDGIFLQMLDDHRVRILP